MNINDSLEAKDSQNFNVDTMVMAKHTVIRPMSKDMRRHARKNMLICLNKKTFHFFIIQKLGAASCLKQS